MKRILIVFLIISLTGYLFSYKDQDADKILEALKDRLTCPHLHAEIMNHGRIYFKIEEDKKLAYMIWRGNKVIKFRVTVHDQKSGKFALVGNILELNSGYGKLRNSLFINIAGKSLYMKNVKGVVIRLGKLRMEERRSYLKAHLTNHKKMRFNICLKSRAGYYILGSANVAVVKVQEVKIRGSSKMNLLKVRSNGPRSFYLNRSRKILFFKNNNKNMDGRFARLKINVEIGMIGHTYW